MNKEFESIIEELQWRGLLQDFTNGLDEVLEKEKIAFYIGFDPTAESLHIGSLVQIIMMIHFQNLGHKPIALLGGATGMIGDPSGKSKERNLLDEETLEKNVNALKNQFMKFLDFDEGSNSALLLNNFDWTKDISVIEFVRDIGKHISVNYMMAKESVKKRIESTEGEGMSFTEFSYQLFQGFDFAYLRKNHDCVLQIGGSDQWGNIVTGIELSRRKYNLKAHGLTCPLITKTDGTKFGKTEKGNIWLSKERTSIYSFYQYWINTSDEDAESYIKIFTFASKKEIEQLISEHKEEPHMRILQKRLAKEVTVMVHSEEQYIKVVEASKILFGKNLLSEIEKIENETLLDVFKSVPQSELKHSELKEGLSIVDVLTEKTEFLKSKGEARRSISANSISVNNNKIGIDYSIEEKDLLKNKFIILRKGKKDYFLITVN